jgi:hypothetical protein
MAGDSPQQPVPCLLPPSTLTSDDEAQTFRDELPRGIYFQDKQ